MSRHKVSGPHDRDELSPRQQTMLDIASQLEHMELPSPLANVLSAWLEREALLAATQAGQYRAQGIRADAADFSAEDDPGFMLAWTFASLIAGGTTFTPVVQ